MSSVKPLIKKWIIIVVVAIIPLVLDCLPKVDYTFSKEEILEYQAKILDCIENGKVSNSFSAYVSKGENFYTIEYKRGIFEYSQRDKSGWDVDYFDSKLYFKNEEKNTYYWCNYEFDYKDFIKEVNNIDYYVKRVLKNEKPTGGNKHVKRLDFDNVSVSRKNEFKIHSIAFYYEGISYISYVDINGFNIYLSRYYDESWYNFTNEGRYEPKKGELDKYIQISIDEAPVDILSSFVS